MNTKNFKSLPHLFFDRAKEFNSIVALYFNSQESKRDKIQLNGLTWQELKEKVSCLAAALIKKGIEAGDRVGILANTRYEWTIADIAILSARGIVSTFYHTCTPSELVYLINDSGTKYLFVEDKKQLDKIQQILKEVNLELIIVLDNSLASSEDKIINFDEFILQGNNYLQTEPELVSNTYEQIEDKDIATIVYTSGTSGVLKGVVLTHRNILYQLDSIPHTVPLSQTEYGDLSLLAFLTSAHIFQRIAGQWYFLSQGQPIYFCNKIERVAQYLKECPADVILAVPLLLEKIKAKVYQQIKDLDPKARDLVSLVLQAAIELKKTQLKSNNFILKKISGFAHGLLYKAILKKIKDKISPYLKAIISGGAPLSEATMLFYHAIGIYLIEGYGLTETTGILCANSFYFIESGSAGRLLKGVELKIADDGEILTRGEIIFSGYWNKPESTKEAFNEEGWFKTGDLGHLNEKGFLFITGRKKDLIVTAGGKKIAPTFIEEKIKQSPYIDQIAVFGDKQKWLTALITLNQEMIQKNFNQEKINTSWEDLIRSKELIEFIEKEIEQSTMDLPEFERVRKFKILADSFSQAKDELTHTMKVKRSTILKNYQSEIESLHK